MWPDFFIIGVPKSGTTALSEYLHGHPILDEARNHRSTKLGHFMPRPPGHLVKAAVRARETLGIGRLGLIDRLRGWNTSPRPRDRFCQPCAARRRPVALPTARAGSDRAARGADRPGLT